MPTARKPATHVHMEETVMVCSHCGETYAPALPAPLSIIAAIAKEFARIHGRCKPRRDYFVLTHYRAKPGAGVIVETVKVSSTDTTTARRLAIQQITEHFHDAIVVKTVVRPAAPTTPQGESPQ